MRWGKVGREYPTLMQGKKEKNEREAISVLDAGISL